MKKFTSATDLGGAPIFKNDLREVFNDEIWDAIEALLSQFNSDVQGIVVSGCVTTANASNFNMTAGIVYLNGEFMRVAAVTNQAFTKYIAPKAVINDTRSFADTTSHVVTIDKQAELVSSIPGSGQYIAIASLTDLDDRRWNPATQAQITTVSGGAWQSASLSTSDITNGSGINPTSIGTCVVEYRIGEKEVFVFIKLRSVVFAAIPNAIRIVMPTQIRTYLNAGLGSGDQMVSANVDNNGGPPNRTAANGDYNNTNSWIELTPSSYTGSDFIDATLNTISCQFFVKV